MASIRTRFAGDLSSRQEGLDLNPRYAAQTKDAAPELIVLVSVDALRPDFVGFYGYSKHPTTPKLDRWARQAVVFDSAYTTGPYTTIAMPSLLTGLGMGQMPGYISDLFEERLSSPTVKLPASVDTLAEGLKSAGYKTHAIVSGFDVRLNDFDQGIRRGGGRDDAESGHRRSGDRSGAPGWQPIRAASACYGCTTSTRMTLTFMACSRTSGAAPRRAMPARLRSWIST